MMRTTRPLKIVFKAGKAIFKISLKIALATVLSEKVHKEAQEFREWQDDYDDYIKAVTRRKSF